MAGTTRFKRTQFVVDRAYQLRFVLRLISVVFGVVIVSLLACSSIMWFSLTQRNDNVDLYAFIEMASTVTLALSIEVMVALPVIYYFGIRHTHRVVGPIERIKRTLKAISEGDFSARIHPRKGDVLMDLCNSINVMAEQLEQREKNKQ